MKNIELKKLILVQFKRIVKQEIDFSSEQTFIHGANEAGKTSVFDAFTWLLFGKDSTGRSDFNVKTLDKNNKVIEKLEHSVEGVFIADGMEIVMKRILKEKWQKKRGALESEFTGNETEYYWNGVPMQQKEFQLNVSQLIDESAFKIITNPLAFNSLKWQERRNILESMVPMTDEDIVKTNTPYAALLENVKKHKSMEEYKKMVLASVKKAKEDIKAIPTRIDEATRNKPEYFDFPKLKEELEEKEIQVKHIDSQIQSKSAAFDELIKQRNASALTVSNLKLEVQKIENVVRNEAKQAQQLAEFELTANEKKLKEYNESLEYLIKSKNTLISKKDELAKKITDLTTTIDSKRNEWEVENSKEFVFDDSKVCCPTCKRGLEASDVEAKKEEMLANFQKDKSETLTKISNAGKSLSKERDEAQGELTHLDQRIETGNKVISETESEIQKLSIAVDTAKKKVETATISEAKEEMILETALSMNVEYIVKQEEIKVLEKGIQEIPKVDNSSLLETKAAIEKEMDEIKSKLHNEELIKLADQRILALGKEEKELAQQIADVEKIVFDIENFNKLKMDTIEKRINEKFKMVKFKMFDTQVNGGEVECCEATINGVPFSDANTASRINAGLDIINALCDFYQVSAPIFIDNRESITNVIKTNGQLISLVVSPADKKLRVESKSVEELVK